MADRVELDKQGHQLIKDIMADIHQQFPAAYDTMPHNWIERLWRYCILVWNRIPQFEPKEDHPDSKIFTEHRSFSFLYLFKVFLQQFDHKLVYTNEKLFLDFVTQMNQGIEVMTKSWFRLNTGDVKKERITFLEHYLLMVREQGDRILDRELLDLLIQYTTKCNEIMGRYRLKSYQFLGTFV